MPWQKLSIQVGPDRVAAIEEELEAAGALSVTVTDAADSPILEPPIGSTPLWPDNVISGLFPAEQALAPLIRHLHETLAIPEEALRLETLEDQAWERVWMDEYHPMRFGQHLWIVPSWSEPPDPEAVNILLDPGLAFGTGTHPTTALCLEWLDAHPPTGKLVVDYGCGSGVLAIAALRLGARHAWAVDIDPQALTATEDNADKNGIAAGNLYTAGPDGLPPMQADLVIANILAGPLVELAPELTQLLAPGGRLLLSGILAEQADEVRRAYPEIDWQAHSEREQWACLAGQRKKS